MVSELSWIIGRLAGSGELLRGVGENTHALELDGTRILITQICFSTRVAVGLAHSIPRNWILTWQPGALSVEEFFDIHGSCLPARPGGLLPHSLSTTVVCGNSVYYVTLKRQMRKHVLTNSRNREWNSGCQGLVGGGNGELVVKGDKLQVLKWM